jgi:sugar lactone lactonase YvrE
LFGVLRNSFGNIFGVSGWTLAIEVQLNEPVGIAIDSVHPETPIKIPKLKLWTPNNGHLGIQSFSFGRVSGWTLDSKDNLYIVDDGDARVLKVNATTGIITAVAGNGTQGYSGDGGSATEAQIRPRYGDVAVDSDDNLYIADRDNDCIRKVDSTTGIITTIAGNGTEGYSGDGGFATAAQINHPEDVAIDNEGNIYIADTYNYVIRKVDTNGIITTVAGSGTKGHSKGGGIAVEAQLDLPTGILVDNTGIVYFSTIDNRVFKLDNNGTLITIAGNTNHGFSGDGGLATEALLYFPEDIVLNKTGTLMYINDKNNYRIRKLEWVAFDVGKQRNLLLLASVILLVGFGIVFFYLRLYRHPLVLALSTAPTQLLTVPLEQLFKTKLLLKYTGRLDTILQSNDVPISWLNNAIKFAKGPKADHCVLLAKRLCAVGQTTDDTDVFMLQLGKTFPLNLTNCLVYFPRVDLPAAEIIQLNQEKMSSQVTVVISLVPTQQADLRPEGENLANLWVVPNSRELTELLLSPQPINVFARLLASQLAVTTVSPYKTGGSIEKDSTFFGREKILVQIINRELRNYLLIGGRKLGKSSLLKKIERHYQNHPKVKCFYLSLNDDSLRKLNVTLGLAKNTTLFALLDKLTEVPPGNQYLILIDEADQFIQREIAEGYPTLNKFRSVSEEGHCHFILAGFWNLYEAAVLDYHSPISNFGESIIVGALEREACQQLTTEPMALLGIHYAQEDLVAQIITATGQRVNLVAIVCDEMLKNLPSERRILNAEDVAKALHSWAIQQTLAGWRQLSDDKQAASLDSVHPETLPFASALDSKTLIVWSPKLMRREYFWCFRMDTR